LGLKEVRAKVVDRLRAGRILHDTTRGGEIDEKNLLLIGKVTIEEVIEVINSAKGVNYSTSKHHLDRSVDVHIFKLKKKNVNWYIKCYMIEPDVWFISVHH
jgi:hypothetical protein